jgi:phosphotransferase family enzyme
MASVQPVDELAEITPRWMQSALSAAGFRVSVTDLTAEPIGTGQMSLNFRVKVSMEKPDAECPSSFVLKVPSPNREIRPLVSAGYRSEIGFYDEVLTTVSVHSPRCFLSLSNADSTSFTLLLEDLAPAVQGDQIAGGTPEVMQSAVRNLAALHGPRWCDPTLWDYGWLQPSSPGAHRFTADLVIGALPGLAERLRHRVSDQDLRTLSDSAEVLVRFLGASPHIGLIHGDYRLDNLMITPSGEVSVVDWQTLAVGLPAPWRTFSLPRSRPSNVEKSRRASSQPTVRTWRNMEWRTMQQLLASRSTGWGCSMRCSSSCSARRMGRRQSGGTRCLRQ